MIWIGVDPGATGAMAFLFGNSRRRNVFDAFCPKMYDLLDAIRDSGLPAFGLVEEYIPIRNVITACKLAHNAGVLFGLLDMSRVQVSTVKVGEWRAMFGIAIPAGSKLSPKQRQTTLKKMALKKARELFPTLAHRLDKEGNDGRAEALLIAYYARETYKGQLEENK